MSRPLTDSEALTAILAEEAGKAGPSEVPEPERLLDYLAGRLSPEEEESLGRRLAADPESARALLDLADFEAAGAEAETARDRPREIGIQAAWRDLEKRLPPAAAPPVRRPKALWATSALAALFLATTLVAGLDALRVRQDNARLAALAGKAKPLVALTTLVLATVRGEGIEERALGPGESIRLVLDPEEDCPNYSVRIESPGEGGAETIEDLRTNDQGNLDLLWKGSAGDYELTLSGCEPVQELEKHRFRIIPRVG